MRVGLDIWTDPVSHGTTSVTMYAQVTAQVDSTWSFSDAQTVHLYVNGGLDSTWNFQNNMGANGSVTFLKTWTEYPSYGGGPSWTFSADLTGNYLGGTSTVSQGYTLPTRPPAAPSAPGGAGYSSINATSVFASWSGSPDDQGSGIDTTTIHVAPNSNMSGWFEFLQGGNVNTRTLTGLIPNTTYWTQTYAHNAYGWSGPSTQTSFLTNAFQVPAPSLSSTDPTTIHVTWANPGTSDTPTRYNIQASTDPTFATVAASVASTTWANAADVTGLTPGTNYYVRVQGGTSTGWGTWSPATSLQTLSGAKVMRSGVFIDAPAYVYRNGAWQVATVYKYRNGAWNL